MNRNHFSASNLSRKHPRIGWLADLEQLARNPHRMAEVQDRLGVDTIWLESGRYHTSGYRLSDEVWENSPFKDWRTRPGLDRHRQARHLPENVFPVLPGILAGADDTDLLSVVEYAQQLGIELWGHLGLWSYGGMIYPELAVQTLSGQQVPIYEDRWGACFCPNKPALNSWLADCLADSIRKYPLQGMEVDHARYTPPQSIPNLLVCGCSDCIRRADELGVSLPDLVKTILEGLEGLKKAPVELIHKSLRDSQTILESLDNLIPSHAARNWFVLRARFLSTMIQDMATVVHQTGVEQFVFGIDVLPPSVALLAGHQYSDLTCLDYFTGGFGTIGWERVGLSTAIEWSRFLLRRWPELGEEFVTTQLMRMFGFSDLSIPMNLSRLNQLTCTELAYLESVEISQMAKLRPTGMPVYPPASLPALGVDGLEIVCRSIREHALDGVILAGLENNSEETDRQVAFSLKALG